MENEETKILEREVGLLYLEISAFELRDECKLLLDVGADNIDKNKMVCDLVKILKSITKHATEVFRFFDIPQEMIEGELKKPVDDKIKFDIDNLPKPEELKGVNNFDE